MPEELSGGLKSLRDEMGQIWSVAKEADVFARRAAKALSNVSREISEETDTVYSLYAEKVSAMSGRGEKRLPFVEASDMISMRISEWESIQIIEIGEIVGENGKPLYSNKEKRDAELSRRKSESQEWRDLEESLREAKRNLVSFDDDSEQMKRELSLAKARLEIQLAKLNALATFALR